MDENDVKMKAKYPNITMEDWLKIPIHLKPPKAYEDGVIERVKEETIPNALNFVLVPKHTGIAEGWEDTGEDVQGWTIEMKMYWVTE